MIVYFVKTKGWRYDFTLKGKRYVDQWYTSKQEAKLAEAKKREDVLHPEPISEEPKTQTGITFFELVNYRLDRVKAYNSERHYREYLYMAKRWDKEWEKLDSIQRILGHENRSTTI